MYKVLSGTSHHIVDKNQYYNFILSNKWILKNFSWYILEFPIVSNDGSCCVIIVLYLL
jgi:hypothetical protein